MTNEDRDVVGLLEELAAGQEEAAKQLMPLVYDRLRLLARKLLTLESREHTLQPTALVNEAYIRMVGQKHVEWQGKTQFFAIGAKMMRRILVDHARRRPTKQHGGRPIELMLPKDLMAQTTSADDVLVIERAIDKLARLDPIKAQIVELRLYAGLTIEEIAEFLGVSKRTVECDWAVLRAFLKSQLTSTKDRNQTSAQSNHAGKREQDIAVLRHGVSVWNAHREKCDDGIPQFRGAGLSQHDLRQANFREADFRGADLSRSNLIGAILDGADLTNADLHEVDLRNADLRDANLSSANLRRANLGAANLSGANLDSADLTEAILLDAILSDTSLAGARLSGARVGSTLFASLNLAVVIGLEDVEHFGPSCIGSDTLEMSGGKIPRLFLQGCGTSESLIEYQQSLIVKPVEFYSCFISYSHSDQKFAKLLHGRLQERGIRCWFDAHQLLPGDDIYKEVDQGLRRWDKVLLVASKMSLSSGWVGREIETAIERELQLYKERGEQVLCIIPLSLDDHLHEWSGSHAAAIRKRVAADFRGWESDESRFDEQFERLVNALRADEGARPKPPDARL